ncbi:E3 ubiquitin-protein ligase TRIM45-like, partial [Saccostrea cucullata]|uniref:E3 ubiquitin-protein ligase TRIM45-like n=1 Tax=Saccostrea cuccullata TaxID=36930 RepID=UPI002ED67FEC
MDWPAKSPDLNPIEHAWDILQNQILGRQNQPSTLRELEFALVEEWSRIPQDNFLNLINSFLNRCRESLTLVMDPRTSAQDLVRCDLCETTLVQMHCDTCLVNLCKACVGEHISTNETKDHRVVKYQSRNSTVIYPTCTSHEKEQCEMFCRHCDIPVCHTCLASDQHLSHKLSKLLHVVGEKKDLIRKEHKELNETIYPTYQDIEVDVQKTMSKLEKAYGDLSTVITIHGEEWHKQIDQLVRKLKAQLNKAKTVQLQTLKGHLDEIHVKIVNIKDDIDFLATASDSNDISRPFNVRSNVDKYKKLPQKLVLSLPKFIPGTILIQGEEFCKLYGVLSPFSIKSEEYGYSIKITQKHPEFGYKI